jgi:AraC-like DNA-binding protein
VDAGRCVFAHISDVSRYQGFKMFPKQLDLSGDFEALAGAYGKFLPFGTVTRADDWRLLRWQGHLTVAENRSLWRVRTNREISAHSVGNEGFFVLVIPEEGGVRANVRHRDVVATPGQAVLLHLPEERHLHAYCQGAHARTSVKWNIAEWHKTVATHYGDEPLPDVDFNALLDLTDQRGRVLSRLISAVAHDLVYPVHESRLASALMNEALLRLVFERAGFSDEAASRARLAMPRHVRNALDFMTANAAKPILIRDVAAACGVTARSLEHGFKNTMDTTPLAYLRRIRLDAARKELRGTGVRSVTEVARRWGFVDLSRFSARYRQAFGELPSQTLRRR